MVSYFPNLSDAEGERYGVVTRAGLARALAANDLGAVALSDHALGILRTEGFAGYRPFQTLEETQLQSALAGVLGRSGLASGPGVPERAALGRYRLARVFPQFGQHPGPLYVMLPRH
jgi:hypothetical protein